VRIVNPEHRPESKRLILRNDLSELPRLARWIEALMPRNSSPDEAFAVSLCLEEAVANIIMHGCAKDDTLKISVEVERAAGTLTARIEDNGQRFDPTQVPSPPPAASLDDAKIGNLGIDLIRSFASGMQYERRKCRNRLTLRFLESRATHRGVGQ